MGRDGEGEGEEKERWKGETERGVVRDLMERGDGGGWGYRGSGGGDRETWQGGKGETYRALTSKTVYFPSRSIYFPRPLFTAQCDYVIGCA